MNPTTTEPLPASNRKITIRIKRQDGPKHSAYWEEFALPYRPNMNIIS